VEVIITSFSLRAQGPAAHTTKRNAGPHQRMRAFSSSWMKPQCHVYDGREGRSEQAA